ncbi:MAG: serine/threonine protein kinase [Polyangiaceae bacterium]|nr:serine/threonine protein kinase [Polyangiaceae bacterium]
MSEPELATEEADPTLQYAQSLVGSVLRQKWRLEELLGVGGTAAVFLGVHRNQNRVAVKVLHPELAGYQEVRERFVREAYVANFIGTNNVCKVLDDDITDDGMPFLVMELLSGETLESKWEKANCKMAPKEALRWIDDVLTVLHLAHEKKIIHRDIKPENIFVTSEGVLKVLDFGIARVFQSDQKMTRQGMVMGTPAFMSPEQALGQWDRVDGRTDIWAVGATLFTLMTGRYVHQGRNSNEQLIKSASEEAPKLASVDPYLPRAVCELVDRALAFKVENRFADADTFQQALRRVRKTLDDAAGGASSSVSSEAAIRAAPRHDAQDLGKAQTLPGEAKPLERLGEAQLQGVDPEKAKALIETQLAEIGARRAAIESELMAIKDRRGEIDLQLKRVRGAESNETVKDPEPAMLEKGKVVLRDRSNHPAWTKVEQLARLRDAALAERESHRAALYAYNRSMYSLGLSMLSGAILLVGVLLYLLVKRPGPDTSELPP